MYPTVVIPSLLPPHPTTPPHVSYHDNRLSNANKSRHIKGSSYTDGSRNAMSHADESGRRVRPASQAGESGRRVTPTSHADESRQRVTPTSHAIGVQRRISKEVRDLRVGHLCGRATPAGGPPLKRLQGCFRGLLPAARRMVGHAGPR
jgi:hypothetical protein